MLEDELEEDELEEDERTNDRTLCFLEKAVTKSVSKNKYNQTDMMRLRQTGTWRKSQMIRMKEGTMKRLIGWRIFAKTSWPWRARCTHSLASV